MTLAAVRWVPKYDLPTGMSVSASGEVTGAPFAWQYSERDTVYAQLSAGATAANLQTAINNAPKRSKILLDPDVLITAGDGVITLPVRDGTWTVDDAVYVETTGFRSLVPDGQRVTSDIFGVAGANMARLYSNVSGGHLVAQGAVGSGYLRMVGVEWGYTGSFASACANALYIANANAFMLDRCYYGRRTAGADWPVGLWLSCYGSHNSLCGLVDSHIENVCDPIGARESKCFYFNGDSKFIARNNYLDASSINLMIGAGVSTEPDGVTPWPAGVHATDVLVERNFVTKQPRYYHLGGLGQVKNLAEIKMTDRCLIRYNVFEKSVPDAQSGLAINIKASSWDKTTCDVVCRNVHFMFNWVDDATSFCKVSGQPETYGPPPNVAGAALEPASRVEIGHNIATRIGTGPFCSLNAGADYAMAMTGRTGAHDWSWHHNTVVNAGGSAVNNGLLHMIRYFDDQTGTSTNVDYGTVNPWSFTDSIAGKGDFGVSAESGGGEGNPSMGTWATYAFQRNALVDVTGTGNSGTYTDSTTANGVTSGVQRFTQGQGFAAVFESYTTGDPAVDDFRLKAALAALPQYQDANGNPIGADIDVLELVRAAAISGVPATFGANVTPPVTPTAAQPIPSVIDQWRPKPTREGLRVVVSPSPLIGTGGLVAVASNTVSVHIPVGRVQVSVLSLAFDAMVAAVGSGAITVTVSKVTSGGVATPLTAATSIKSDVITTAGNIALPMLSSVFGGAADGSRRIDGTRGDFLRVDITAAGTVTTQPQLRIVAELGVTA